MKRIDRNIEIVLQTEDDDFVICMGDLIDALNDAGYTVAKLYDEKSIN